MNRQDAIHFLTHDPDTGEDTSDLYVPCSRWGRSCADCAGVAYDLDVILSAETGEGMTGETLEYAMDLVVNDHDDVAYTLREYGDDDIRQKYADELGLAEDGQ